jgi:hypothetical protein
MRNATLALAGASLIAATVSMSQSDALNTSLTPRISPRISPSVAAVNANCPWVA